MTIEASIHIVAVAFVFCAVAYIAGTIARIVTDARKAGAHEKFNELSAKNDEIEKHHDDMLERLNDIMDNLSNARATDSRTDLFRRIDRALECACPPDGAYGRIVEHIRSEEGERAWPRSVAPIKEPKER